MLRPAIILAYLMCSALEASPWIRVATPHFEIYTDSGEHAARRVLARFEQARRVLSTGEWGKEPELQTRVLLFSSERDYDLLRPAANVSGFYQSGPERDYIVMTGGAELDRVVLHEYTHSVLDHAAAPLPQWLEEGLAEVYSTLSVGESRAALGAPIASHLMTLAHQQWLPGEQLAVVDQKSAHYNDPARTGTFYAESWALTHMLMVGEPYRAKFPGFIERLTAGEPPQQAFTAAFGKTLDAAVDDLPGYMRRGFRTIAVEIPPADQIVFSEATVLDTPLAEQARAEVLLLMGRDRAAQRIYEDVAKRYPSSPAAQTGLAVVAMRDRDYERARACFERAIELGARDGSTYFEYAMLLRDTGADPALVTSFLEKAVAANPALAEAHFLLGIRASDREHYSEAVEHLRRATEILPRQAYFWQALSYALHKLGETAPARSAALHALRSATTAHETEMAENALALIEQRASPPPEKKPPVVTPGSWTNPQGDQTISGDLVQVDCVGGTARLHIRTTGGPVILAVDNPRAVRLESDGARRTLSCGTQGPFPVIAEFDGVTKQVTALRFR